MRAKVAGRLVKARELEVVLGLELGHHAEGELGSVGGQRGGVDDEPRVLGVRGERAQLCRHRLVVDVYREELHERLASVEDQGRSDGRGLGAHHGCGGDHGVLLLEVELEGDLWGDGDHRWRRVGVRSHRIEVEKAGNDRFGLLALVSDPRWYYRGNARSRRRRGTRHSP